MAAPQQSFSKTLLSEELIAPHWIGNEFASHNFVIPIKGRLDNIPLTQEYIENTFNQVKHDIVLEQPNEFRLSMAKLATDPVIHKGVNDVQPWKAELGNSASNFIGVSYSSGRWNTKQWFLTGNVGSGKIGEEVRQSLSSTTMSAEDLNFDPAIRLAMKRARSNALRMASEFAEKMGLDIGSQHDDIYAHENDNPRRPVIPKIATPLVCLPVHSISEIASDVFALNRNYVHESIASSGVMHHLNPLEGDLLIFPSDTPSNMNIPVSIAKNPSFDVDSVKFTPEYQAAKDRIASEAYHWENKVADSHPLHATPSFTLPFTSQHASTIATNGYNHLHPVVRVMGTK